MGGFVGPQYLVEPQRMEGVLRVSSYKKIDKEESLQARPLVYLNSDMTGNDREIFTFYSTRIHG